METEAREVVRVTWGHPGDWVASNIFVSGAEGVAFPWGGETRVGETRRDLMVVTAWTVYKG